MQAPSVGHAGSEFWSSKPWSQGQETAGSSGLPMLDKACLLVYPYVKADGPSAALESLSGFRCNSDVVWFFIAGTRAARDKLIRL